MPRLDFDDPEGLHEPVELKIKGTVYSLKKVTKTLFEKVRKLEKSEDEYAGHEQLKLAFGIPKAALEGIDLRIINAGVLLLTKSMTESSSHLREEAKNALGLG